VPVVCSSDEEYSIEGGIMAMKRIVCLTAVVVCVLALPAAAQITTGRVLGTVTGPDGAPMPGVTVTVASDALIGGTRTAVTGETGAYRIAALPPGDYDVTAVLSGFQTETMVALRVNVGASATADFQLQPQFSEEVTVIGETPLVDPTTAATGATYTAEFMEDLPTTRNFYDLMSVAPGVSIAKEDSDRVVATGSNMQSNNWFIDGIETTAPETGTMWIYVNPDTIEEIQVMSIGAPAEYGNMTGAALNVVTKSGSNVVKGGANVYFFDDSFVDSSIKHDSEFPEFHQSEFWDVTATLGGPIVKDRLWFFAAYEYWRDGHAYPGADPDVTPVWFADRYDLKLSIRFNDSNLLEVKGYTDEWGFPDEASEYFEPSALAGEVGDNQAWALTYQGILSDRTLIDARYTGWTSDDDYLSQTGSTEPSFIDYSPPDGGPDRYYGGVYWPWTYDTSIDQLSASVSHFADDFIRGEHDFKFGVQASQGDAATAVAGGSTGTYYYRYTYEYYPGYPYDYYYKVEQRPYVYGNDQESWTAFFDDSWAVTERLTLNLGLRYDHHRGVIPSFPVLDFDWQPTGEMIPGIDPVFTWDNWSPRIGFAYAAGADMNTVIRGSFGVYYDGNVGGNWNSPPPQVPGQVAYVAFSPDGPWDEVAWTWDAGVLNVDPDLKAPRALQYSLSVEKAIANKYSIGVLGVYKDTKDLVGWEILDDGVYEEMEFTDPFTGRQYTLLDPIEFPTVRKGNTPGFTINPDVDGYWQEYWAVILTFKRRFTDFWSMQASYTYSESTGLIPAFLSHRQFNPLYSSKDGNDPNSYLNADNQRLQGDRPHMFRVQANFELAKGFHVNTLVNFQSGRPYSRQIELPTTGHPPAIMEPASDSQRHPDQFLWDIGFGKRFQLGGDVELNLDLQLLNVLNDDATDRFVTLELNDGDDFTPDRWVKPRRLMLRAGVAF
jgi:outer membrane receptor protein involved in Fe transport